MIWTGLLVLILLLTGCSADGSMTVMIEQNHAIDVTDGYSRSVKKGGTVSFHLVIEKGYAYAGNNVGAEYENQVLSLSDVHANTMIVIDTIPQNNTNGTMQRIPTAEGYLYSAVPNEEYVFCGWTYVEDGQNRLYSYCNNLVVSDDTVLLSPNFLPEKDHTFVTYHANGASMLNSEDDSMTLCFQSDVYAYPVCLGKEFFSVFTRKGYAPLEYNTEPDGSGTAFSLGSRMLLDGQRKEVYVIWAKETDASQFDFEVLREEDDAVAIAVTACHSDNDRIVVPETIEGLPVQEIRSGTFSECAASTIVLPRFLRSVEEGAFTNCEALETLYMCDAVEMISDHSFAGCPNLANLRMNAVLAPAHCANSIASLVRRVEVLYKSRNSEKPKLLFYGGSASYHGIDGKKLSNYFGGKMDVLNLGQNANLSGVLMLDMYAHFLREDDVLVFIPEYWLPLYSNQWQMVDWIAIEAFYDALRFIDIRDYDGVFDAFNDYQNGTKNFSFKGKLFMPEGSYDEYADDFDAYFTRNYIANYDSSIKMSDSYVDIERIQPAVSNIEYIYTQKILPQKARFYFSFAPLYVTNRAREPEFLRFSAYLRENLSCAVLGEPTYFWYTREMFFDSPVHLTTEGAAINSDRYGMLIRNQFREDGYSGLK